MPLYDYRCASCGGRFEILCAPSAREEKAVCPVCGGRDVTQVFGAFRVGISRTLLNPGVFERTAGGRPEYKPPRGG